jgi:hypothetical protein
LILALACATGDKERLPMRLACEPTRADIWDPDLNRSQSATAEALSMSTNLFA